MTGAGESSPEVIAYRLGQIESTLRELRDESITPAVYNAHRQAAIEAEQVYRDAIADRFTAIEREQIKQEEIRERVETGRRTTRLALGLAIVSPVVVIILDVLRNTPT